MGQAGRPPSLGQDREGIQQTSEEQSQRCRQQARPHGGGSANREAWGNNDHSSHPTEQDANIRAFKYFSKHVRDFNIIDDSGRLLHTEWKSISNPIIGFNWEYSLNSDVNQQALKAGRLSLGWADYVFGPLLIIPGIIDVFELKQ